MRQNEAKMSRTSGFEDILNDVSITAYDDGAVAQYESLVDRLILQQLDHSHPDFNQLLVSLPGVYPSTVLRRLEHLTQTLQLDEQCYRQAVTDSSNGVRRDRLRPGTHHIKLPIEHPVDFEWRFSQMAAETLLSRAETLVPSDELIAILGAPTILRHSLETNRHRSTVLIDKNPLIENCFISYPHTSVVRRDLLRDSLPDIAASVVIVDPPWYDEYMRAFLWAANALSISGSHILMSVPPIGTRPGVVSDLQQLRQWMEQFLGINLLHVDEAALPYRSPAFERNALRAEGIANVLPEWRRGDLWIMKTGSNSPKPGTRPITREIDITWHESVVENVRFKVRGIEDVTRVCEPLLGPIVDKDVLPSVSRRDSRRFSVDIWTSGNRVFTSSNARLLHVIIRALSADKCPKDQVATFLKRGLASEEELQVSSTVDHLRQVISTECEEYARYDEE